jgi:hypothetical protein
MALDEDHQAQGFRHSSGKGEAGEAWASFSTLATGEAGIRRPYHHAVNLHTSLAHRPDPNPNAGRRQASPEGLPALGVVQLSGWGAFGGRNNSPVTNLICPSMDGRSLGYLVLLTFSLLWPRRLLACR